MNTNRLYYLDPYRITFDAQVVEVLDVNGSPAVALDRSAFYPTGGGQPCDTGTLNGIRVVDVIEREQDGAPLHVLSPERPEQIPGPGSRVRGEIDWQRRFDHMQQHSGQHLLSQAFVHTIGAETVGFHLSSDYSTIDLNSNALNEGDIARAESLTNQIVFEDRPVLARFYQPEDAAGLPLRKRPPAKESIRVVHVEGFDWSACGGTHVTRTGQIGLVKIIRDERRGPETRITFLCGERALRHYHMLNTLIRDLALGLTTGVEELPQAVERLQAEARALRKERDQVRDLLLAHEAAALAAAGEVIGPVRLVHHVFEDRDVQELRRLASRTVEEPGRVALFGLRGTKAQLVFARSADLGYDMRSLLRDACRLVGGGGGGSPDMAQGGGPQEGRVDEALAYAAESLRRQVEEG
jgi:alanyl-tRNA synthetase